MMHAPDAPIASIMLTHPKLDSGMFQAMLYHDLPNGEDSFVLSIMKMNLEAGLISTQDFLARVQDLQDRIQSDVQRHEHNLEIAKAKKLVANGEMIPPTVSVSFAVMLQQARSAKKWSQKDLALKMNIKQSDYAKWEKAEGSFPTPQQRAKLNRLLGIVLPPTFS
jgi:DNA-binding transcriptional regulator YiaG